MEGGGVTFLGGPSAGFRALDARANPEQIANLTSRVIPVHATHAWPTVPVFHTAILTQRDA